MQYLINLIIIENKNCGNNFTRVYVFYDIGNANGITGIFSIRVNTILQEVLQIVTLYDVIFCKKILLLWLNLLL